MKKKSKRMSNILKTLDQSLDYDPKDAIVELKKSCSSLKFDPSFELSLALGIDLKKLNTTVRGLVSLPAGTGKNIRVAVLCSDKFSEDAKLSGADLVGSVDLIEEINSGKINFDVCIATPDMMSHIGKVARILGPKKLMPNIKLGTLTTDVKNAVKASKAGQVEFRADKNNIINIKFGKSSFTTPNLEENFKTLMQNIISAQPKNTKEQSYLKKIFISYTMGPSLKIKLSYIENFKSKKNLLTTS